MPTHITTTTAAYVDLTDSGETTSHTHPAPTVDAAGVTYTPAVATDWDGDADPGDVDNALDQLAERVDDLEGAGPGGAHTIRENGTDQTARTGLNFVDADAGTGLVVDDAGNNETEIHLDLYRLEAADHSHQSTGLQAGQLDHGAALTGLSDNDHPQYLLVTDIDDTPVNGETSAPISSNWAFDHVAAADPHTGYRLESADHTHQSTGAQAGQLDHGAALTGLADNDHPQYLLVADDDVVYVPTTADTAVNSVTDITIVTRDVTSVAAGDQIIVEGHFTILNNSGATRVYVITVDFDGLFDIEISTGALATSATLIHPFYFRAVLDVRSTSLCYEVVTVEGQLAAGIASGTDTTMAATHLRGMGWGTSASNVTGTTTVALFVRSANATATQTLRLHHFVIRKVNPT